MQPEAVTGSTELDLRFDEAGAVPAAPACSVCGAAISAAYYEAAGAVVCTGCKATIEAQGTEGSAPGRLARAALFGAGGAVAGAGLYYAILALTGYEIGLVAIAVGWLVGRAVQLGSRARGGPGYQTLAVALTYLAIVSTYVPFILEGLGGGSMPGGVAIAALAITAMSAPFLAGVENILGLVIIGFAVYQAWTMNARRRVTFTGPYALGAQRPTQDVDA